MSVPILIVAVISLNVLLSQCDARPYQPLSPQEDDGESRVEYYTTRPDKPPCACNRPLPYEIQVPRKKSPEETRDYGVIVQVPRPTENHPDRPRSYSVEVQVPRPKKPTVKKVDYEFQIQVPKTVENNDVRYSYPYQVEAPRHSTPPERYSHGYTVQVPIENKCSCGHATNY